MNSTAIAKAVMFMGTNPLIGILSFIAAIISIILAIIFYKYSRKLKKPYYTISSHNLIKDFVSKINSLDIKYSGKPIKNFTISKIAFWNSGNETIDKDDIVNADPIIIHVKNDGKILEAKIIASNNESNCFSLTDVYDDCKINMNFDYIDKDDGVGIQVYHTGSSNKDIEVCGRIKGVGKPRFISLHPGTGDRLKLAFVCFLISLFSLIMLLIVKILLYNYNPLSELNVMITGLFGTSYVIFTTVYFALFLTRKRKTGRLNILMNRFFSREPEGLELIEVPPDEEDEEYDAKCGHQGNKHVKSP